MIETRTRPLGLWVIVIVELINAAVTLVDVTTGSDLFAGGIARLGDQSDLFRSVVIGWCLLVIASAVLLWRLSRRGWALMMVLVGLGLAANLALWWMAPAETQWLRLALNVAAAFYLNSAQIRDRFLQPHEVSRISLGSRNAA